MSTIIEVEKLKKTFRSFQLHDIAFHVSEGCITGLIGIDGSGKSTIIKCLINLIQRDSGKVEFWGENINDKNYSVMNRVGTILSGNEFYDGLTIRETKKIISGAYSNWNETVFQEYWARWKGRDCSEKQRLSTMSRQERVLLSIAIAVAHDSDVLILDEPFRGVDSVGCGKVLAILRDFVKTERRGILISSQDGMDISPVVDDLILIDDGSLVFHEEKDLLLERHRRIKGTFSMLKQIPNEEFLKVDIGNHGFTGICNDYNSIKPFCANMAVERSTVSEIMRAYLWRRANA